MAWLLPNWHYLIDIYNISSYWNFDHISLLLSHRLSQRQKLWACPPNHEVSQEKITAYYQNTVGIKKYFYRKIKCCYNASIHVIFPHHQYCHRPRVVMVTFRWKLHTSSQAWPLLSTFNRGETAIAKCGNYLIDWLITQTPVSGSCCLSLGALQSMWATWCKI